jgi:glycosyltransferase involved in cell wall biosynthesis
MHICMITREFPPASGGIGYFVYNLSKNLLKRGHQVSVFTRGSTAQSMIEIIEGIEVVKVSFFPLYPFHLSIHGLFLNSMFKSLERKFDIVHFHSPLPPMVKTSLPLMTTVHTSMKIDSKYHEAIDFFSLSERLQSMYVYPPIESKIFKNSDYITAVSSSVIDELKYYGLHTSQMTVIGNGVNECVFYPRKNPNTSKYVLYTGILRARKGLFDLLQSAQLVNQVYPNIQFLICGNGPFFRRLADEINKRQMQKYVRILGQVKREILINLYQNALIHVTPSHYEGLPTVLLEAMSCGLPVVATKVGGNQDVISHGVNGLLVSPKNPQEMAEAILTLLNNPKLCAKIGKEARRTIEERYTWDKITDNILLCYQKTIINALS